MYVDAQTVSALLANISNEISSRLIRTAVNKVWQVSAQRDEHGGELLLLKMRSVLATYPHAPYKTGENPCVFLGLITARSCRSATVSPYIKGRIMDKSLLPLISKIDSYISRNTETSLVIFLSTDFYQRILHSNRTSFNLTYDPPKLLGHSFSVRDDIDTMEKQFFVTSETAL